MADTDEIEQLLLRVAQADRAALAALYEHTSAKLFGVCLRVLKDKQEAEDALQDVYVTIWQKANRYSVNGLSPMTWLITIARNRAVDRLRYRNRDRSRVRRDPVETAAREVPDLAPGPEATAIHRDEVARLDTCLAELPEERAAAVRAAYIEGQTYRDLATRFDVPLNTMRTWLRRSLLKLKDCLSQ